MCRFCCFPHCALKHIPHPYTQIGASCYMWKVLADVSQGNANYSLRSVFCPEISVEYSENNCPSHRPVLFWFLWQPRLRGVAVTSSALGRAFLVD